jgi:hypothetical protein
MPFGTLRIAKTLAASRKNEKQIHHINDNNYHFNDSTFWKWISNCKGEGS